jgi:hypothetical protein
MQPYFMVGVGKKAWYHPQKCLSEEPSDYLQRLYVGLVCAGMWSVLQVLLVKQPVVIRMQAILRMAKFH